MTDSSLQATQTLPNINDIPEPVLYGANRCLSDRFTLEQCMDLMVAKYLMGNIRNSNPFTLSQCFQAMRLTYNLSPYDAARLCYMYELDASSTAYSLALSYPECNTKAIFAVMNDIWNLQNQGEKGNVSEATVTDGFIKAGRIQEQETAKPAPTSYTIPELVLYVVNDHIANKQSPNDCMEYLRAKFLMTYAIFDSGKAPLITFSQCMYAICQTYKLSLEEAAQLCYDQCTDTVTAATHLAINYHKTTDPDTIFKVMNAVWNLQNQGKKGKVRQDIAKAGFIKAGLLAVPQDIDKLIFTPNEIPDHLLYGTNYCLSNNENAEQCLNFLIEKYLSGDISGVKSPFTFLQCLQATCLAYKLSPEELVQACYSYDIDAITTSAHFALSYQTTDMNTLFMVMADIWNIKNQGKKGLISANVMKEGFIKAGLLRDPNPTGGNPSVIDGAQLCYNRNIDPVTAITYLIMGYNKADLNDIADAMIMVWNINNNGAKGIITKTTLMSGFAQAGCDLQRIDTSVFQGNVYIRHTLGDAGDTPGVGVLSHSPDIIPRQSAMADYSEFFIQRWNDDTLSQNIKYGANNYLYVRTFNRGSAPDIVNIRLYWSEPAMLISPAQWSTKNLIGELKISRRIKPGEHFVHEFMWPAGKIPYNGHYCFIAVIDSVRRPTPIPDHFSGDNEYMHWINTNNTVAWHNFDVILASAQKPFTLFNNNAVLYTPLLRSTAPQNYSIKLYESPSDKGAPLPVGTVITTIVNGKPHKTTLESTQLPYTLCENITALHGQTIPLEVEITLPASAKKGDTFLVAIAQFMQDSNDEAPLGALNRLIVVQ